MLSNMLSLWCAVLVTYHAAGSQFVDPDTEFEFDPAVASVDDTDQGAVVNMPADINKHLIKVMTEEDTCNKGLFRRFGTIFTHKQGLISSLSGTWGLEEYELRYPDDINCTFTINVGKASIVQLQFIGGAGFECGEDDKTICDCLYVFDGVDINAPLISEICGRKETVAAVRSTGPFMTLWLKMDKNCKTNYGAQMQWNAQRPSDSCDDMEELKCDSTYCIPVGWACDGQRQCQDGADEAPGACPPAERLCLYFATLEPREVFLTMGAVALFLATLLIICCYVYCQKKSGGYGGRVRPDSGYYR